MGFTLTINGIRAMAEFIPLLVIVAIGLLLIAFGNAKNKSLSIVGYIIVLLALLLNITVVTIR